MRNKILILVALSVITGLVGFAWGNFDGVMFIRLSFIVFCDILVVTLLAQLLFRNKTEKVRA